MRKILIIYLVFICNYAYPQASELLVNGDFSNGNYWATETGWSISEGTARFNGQSDLPRYAVSQTDANMISSIQPNTKYLLKFDLFIEEGIARLSFMSSNKAIYLHDVSKTYSKNGSYWVEFTTPANIGVGGFALVGWEDPYNGFKIDNVSLMEIASGSSPYFVALDGNDAASGDINNPWITPEKAFRTAVAGDTVYFRGGRYLRTPLEGGIHVVSIDSAGSSDDKALNGEPDNYVYFWGYPPDVASGDSVIFDFSRLPEKQTGLYLGQTSYYHLKDLNFRNLWQKSAIGYAVGIMGYAPHNMIYEKIRVDTVGGWGMFSSTWDWKSRGLTDSTYWINCDFSYCIDSFAVGNYQLDRGWAGTQAVGLFVVSYPGCYYEYSGCRSWMNADDGYNFAGPGPHRVKNTWSFINGIYFPYLDYESSGNGYKVNSNSEIDRLNSNGDIPLRYMTNTIAAYNRGLGYTENKGSFPSLNRNMYNNVAWRNNQGFVTQGEDDIFVEYRNNAYINNLAYENEVADAAEYRGAYFMTNEYNSWNDPPGVTVTDADFIVTDSATIVNQLKAPRKADGSLPDITAFRLAEGSGLIDAGIDVGLPYNGSAPDLGPFEYEYQPDANNKYPSVEIVAPVSGSRYIKKKSMIISVEASDDGSISSLELFNNDTLLEQASNSNLTYKWNNPPAGTFFLRAIATDDQGAKAKSSLVLVTIESADLTEPEQQICFDAILSGNRTRDTLLLELPKGLPIDTDLTIVSVQGRTVKVKELPKVLTSVKYSIDVGSLDDAMYYIYFDNSEGYQPCQPFDPKFFKY